MLFRVAELVDRCSARRTCRWQHVRRLCTLILSANRCAVTEVQAQWKWTDLLSADVGVYNLHMDGDCNSRPLQRRSLHAANSQLADLTYHCGAATGGNGKVAVKPQPIVFFVAPNILYTGLRSAASLSFIYLRTP